MTSPIDSLYYQWATSEEDRAMPGILEEIAQSSESEKISDLLGVFAHMVTDVIEAEVERNVLVESYIRRVQEDPELLEAAELDEIAAAIEEMPDVVEASEAVESAAKRLDMFHRQLTRALAGEYL